MAKSSIERLKIETDDLLRLTDNQVKRSQSERLIARFGSVLILHARLNDVGLKIGPQAIYMWSWDKTKGGSNGVIPSRNWPYIIRAAILEGIVLNAEDFDPRPLF